MSRGEEVDDAEVTAIVHPAAPPGGQAVQRVEGRFVTAVAVQKPRSLPLVQRRLEEEATLSGESFYYGWGAGKDAIEGPSVKLAMAAVRCWGNCSVEMLPLQETADSWVFTAAFVDYETGFTLQRQFRQSKTWTVHGKLDHARKEDIRFQIGQSKAVRNVVLNALPSGLVDRAMEVAKDGARKKLEGFIARIDKEKGKGAGLVQAADMVLKGLAKHGAKEEAVLRKLEVADRKALDLDRLLVLRGDLAALDNGETRADELYPASKAEQLAERLGGGRPAASAANPAHLPGVDEPGLDGPGELFPNGRGLPD
jgi:hypothetical protein